MLRQIDESAGAMGMYFRRVAQLAQMDIRHQVRVSQALASLADARSKHPFGPIDPTERVYPAARGRVRARREAG